MYKDKRCNLDLNMNVASFNVRGISSQIGKDQLVKDLESYKLNIIALQETKCAAIDKTIQGHRLITFEHDNVQGGLGFLISKSTTDLIDSYWFVHERLSVLKLKPSTSVLDSEKPTLIINTHHPTTTTTQKNKDERELLYNETERLLREHARYNIISLGDWNSKIGKKTQGEECLGQHTKGVRNDNGQRLIDFCVENDLFITNSAFKHSSRHLTTWQGSYKTKEDKIVNVYNQIDFIIVKDKHKNYLKDSRTYSGTNKNSDHRLLVAKFKPNEQKSNRQSQRRRNKRKPEVADFTSLCDSNIRSKFQSNLESKFQLQRHTNDSDQPNNPNSIFEQIKQNIIATRETTLPKRRKQNRQEYCPLIQNLSDKQKEIRIQINDCKSEEKKQRLKRERNAIMHDIKTQSLKNHVQKIDSIALEIQNAPDSMKMYKAVKNLKQTERTKLIISDENGAVLCDDKKITQRVQQYYEEKYKGERAIEPFDETFDETDSGLETPITAQEVNSAIGQLNNNRAPGPDTVRAEEIKSLTNDQQKLIANIFNDMLAQRMHLDIGSGNLVLLNKPNKKKGPMENLRPIVLLSIFRKILSIITLNRIRPKVEQYLSPSQSGFRKDRSTSDIVWAHRWLKARTDKFKEEFTILGIDMSSAFDTICRTKLIETLKTFLGKDDIKLIRTLLANTTLNFTSGEESVKIKTTLGTPQGDSLSPILFVVYLEAALRELREKLPHSNRLTRELIYADDVDLLFETQEEARRYTSIISSTLKEWNLKVNESKTEITTIERGQNEWKKVRKLGSLIDEKEDIKRRKILAQNAHRMLKNLWARKEAISEKRRLQLYESLVLPILLYNCGTWGLTKSSLESLDAFHRKQLRITIGIHWPDVIKNDELYARCQTSPLSQHIKKQRWQLFGHILRRESTIPAQTSMTEYFEKGGKKFRGRPPTSLPTVLNGDLKSFKQPPNKQKDIALPHQLHTQKDLQTLTRLANNRQTWRKISKLMASN